MLTLSWLAIEEDVAESTFKAMMEVTSEEDTITLCVKCFPHK